MKHILLECSCAGGIGTKWCYYPSYRYEFGCCDFPSAKRQPAQVGEWREDALLGELEPRTRLIRRSSLVTPHGLPEWHGSPWLNIGGGSSWMTRVAWMVVGSGERLFQRCKGRNYTQKISAPYGCFFRSQWKTSYVSSRFLDFSDSVVRKKYICLPNVEQCPIFARLSTVSHWR